MPPVAGNPILAARDTNAGAFVVEHDLGWAVAALHARVYAGLAEFAAERIWEMRARQVAANLGALTRHGDRLGAGARRLSVVEQKKG
jgi:hypothetical protein